MVTLSLAMFVKNEAERLPAVLESVKMFCDELVVVDTGSTDDTVAVAEKMGAKVFHFQWVDDFAAARNFSFECCTSDWILFLDADDVIPESEQVKIVHLKANVLGDALDVVAVNYKYRFNNNNECIEEFVRERFIRRATGLKAENALHERIPYLRRPHLVRGDIWIEHRPDPSEWETKTERNLALVEKKIEAGDDSPHNLFIYANDLFLSGQHAKALAVYEKLVALPSGTLSEEQLYIVLLNRMLCCFSEGRDQEGLESGMQAILHNSDCAEAFLQMGLYYVRKEAPREAIPFLTAATVLPKPGFVITPTQQYQAQPYHYLAICYCALAQGDMAVQMAKKALELGTPDKEQLVHALHSMAEHL